MKKIPAIFIFLYLTISISCTSVKFDFSKYNNEVQVVSSSKYLFNCTDVDERKYFFELFEDKIAISLVFTDYGFKKEETREAIMYFSREIKGRKIVLIEDKDLVFFYSTLLEEGVKHNDNKIRKLITFVSYLDNIIVYIDIWIEKESLYWENEAGVIDIYREIMQSLRMK